MSAVDHRANAEKLMAERGDNGVPSGYQMEALVSATLYLAEQQAAAVEQQRIANLIATLSANGITEHVADLGFADWNALLAYLKNGLGLT